jgi:hypothetical protein
VRKIQKNGAGAAFRSRSEAAAALKKINTRKRSGRAPRLVPAEAAELVARVADMPPIP